LHTRDPTQLDTAPRKAKTDVESEEATELHMPKTFPAPDCTKTLMDLMDMATLHTMDWMPDTPLMTLPHHPATRARREPAREATTPETLLPRPSAPRPHRRARREPRDWSDLAAVAS